MMNSTDGQADAAVAAMLERVRSGEPAALALPW